MKWIIFAMTTLHMVACVSEQPFSTNPLLNVRPYLSAAPDNYDGLTALPLVVTLHGLGGNGHTQGYLSGLQNLVNTRQFVLVAPDGTELVPETSGWHFSCCDERLWGVDDVAYLRAVINDASTRYHIDPNRVYITGYSNGGFMAYQMACQAADLISAVAVHAGTFKVGEESECRPEHPLGILHAQGTEDEDVDIGGGSLDYGKGDVPYLSAQDTLSFWKIHNGCSDVKTTATLDADSSVDGSETVVHTFDDCMSNRNVVFWEMIGSTHGQNHTSDFSSKMIDFLFSHAKSSEH